MSFLGDKKRILVTGGSGFIGGEVIRKLLSEKDLCLYNLDKYSYASDNSSINKRLSELEENNNKYTFLKIDLADKSATAEAIDFSKPDLILHLAAESHVDRSIDNSDPFIRSNIIGTYNLLESARCFWGGLNIEKRENFKFIHISTDEVFGSLGEEGRFDEETPYSPRSPYSASKAASDHLVSAWQHTYNLPTLITNCSNNFGPWQFPEKLIPLVINKAIRKEQIPIYGDGKNIRDWLYVEDHVSAIFRVANLGIPGERYCIGGNNEKRNIDLVKEICQILDKKIPSDYKLETLIEFVKDRPGHDARYAINSKNIKEKLDWEPKFSFSEGLSKTIDWYLENQDWCRIMLKKSNYNSERIGLSDI